MVTGVGHFVGGSVTQADVIGRAPDLSSRARVLGAGDNVVDRYNSLGLMFPGGNALNVAVFARRAGAAASYIGALGDDEAGRHVLACLRAEGVGVDRVRVVPGSNAYTDIALHDGDRVFIGYGEGVSRFTLDGDDLAYAATFDIVHTGDSSFLEAQLPSIATHAAVSFDLSVNRDATYLARILPFVRLAFFSGRGLSMGEVEELITSAQAQGPALVIATLGSRGSVGFDGHSLCHQAAVPVDPVDTLGAGDAYMGQFLVEYVKGVPLPRAMELAAKAASTACGRLGAFGYATSLRQSQPRAEDRTKEGEQG